MCRGGVFCSPSLMSPEAARSPPHTQMACPPALIVFVRHPTPGAVKTRLAAGVGAEAAALFYRRCAERVVAQAAR